MDGGRKLTGWEGEIGGGANTGELSISCQILSVCFHFLTERSGGQNLPKLMHLTVL